jgi:hypothetical protein
VAKGRYSDTPLLDGKSYKTFSTPVRSAGYVRLNLLEGVETFDYDYKAGDRLDHLAAKFLGDDQYWWVIALVNDISYPFASGGLVPGKTLKIPTSAQDVLDKIMR